MPHFAIRRLSDYRTYTAAVAYYTAARPQQRGEIMSGFMQHQVTVEMEWWKVDGREGTEYFPCDDFTAAEAAAAYEFPQGIDTIERVTGFGARLSAPGFLDCTEWDIFATEADAYAALLDQDMDYLEAVDEAESADMDDFNANLGSHIDPTDKVTDDDFPAAE